MQISGVLDNEKRQKRLSSVVDFKSNYLGCFWSLLQRFRSLDSKGKATTLDGVVCAIVVANALTIGRLSDKLDDGPGWQAGWLVKKIRATADQHPTNTKVSATASYP